MKFKVINIGDILNEKHFSRQYCKQCVREKKKKCINFYSKLKESEVIYNHVICPYGYSIVSFSNQVIPSLITTKSNIIKIKRRNNYKTKSSKHLIIENYEENLISYEDEYRKFSKAYFLYKKHTRLLHDISNSIAFFLDIKAPPGIIGEDLERGFILLNKILISIKKTKTNDLEVFDYNKDYDKIFFELEEKFNSFFEEASRLYIEADKLEYSQSAVIQNIVSGYGFFNTLIEYHTRLNTQFISINNRVLKPHRMMKKLSRMLESIAQKRNISIKFTERSHSTENHINNLSDVFIAFFSILENAIKYSLPKNVIYIDILDVEDYTIVSIKNKCNNFEEGDLSKITQLGYKGSNNRGDIQSSGYGLYLVNEIFSKGKINFNIKNEDSLFVVEVVLKNIN